MTPVKRYVEASTVSGSMRAEVEVHPPQGNPGESREPTVLVHLHSATETTVTHESLIAFTAEISQVVSEERDGEEPRGPAR